MRICLCVPLVLGGADWRAALESGDYLRAWEESRSLEAGAQRCGAEARILYQAGDPSGALAAARRGLVLAPDQLELHFYAAGAELWLGEAGAAVDATRALEAALARATLAPDEDSAWQRTLASFSEQAEQLTARARLRDKALGRARTGAWLGLVLAALGLVFLTWSLGRARAGSAERS